LEGGATPKEPSAVKGPKWGQLSISRGEAPDRCTVLERGEQLNIAPTKPRACTWKKGNKCLKKGREEKTKKKKLPKPGKMK